MFNPTSLPGLYLDIDLNLIHIFSFLLSFAMTLKKFPIHKLDMHCLKDK